MKYNSPLNYYLDKLLNRDSLLIQIRDIASKWEDLGVALDIPYTKLQEIMKMRDRGDLQCLIEVCDCWLKAQFDSRVTPTWTSISTALLRIGSDELSKEIKEIYKTGNVTLIIV